MRSVLITTLQALRMSGHLLHSTVQYSTKLDNDRNLYPRAQLFGTPSSGQVRSDRVEDSFEVDGVLDYADLLVPLGQRL